MVPPPPERPDGGSGGGGGRPGERPGERPDAAAPLTIQPERAVAEAGQEVRLYCSGSTAGFSRFGWTKEGGRVPFSAVEDGTGSLTIPDARQEFSGVYVCSAVDSQGVSHEARATVEIFAYA